MSSHSLIQRIGPMRLLLLICTLLLYPVVWFSDMEPQGIGVLTAYVAPALAVIFLFVLLLDALMNRVFMIDKEGEEKGVPRTRMWLDLAAVAGLVAFWWPYFRDIGAL